MKKLIILAFAVALAACAHKPPQTMAGPDFLVRNAAAKGVATLPSGVQYFVLDKGPKSGNMPTAIDEVTFHYEGKLTTGETFDSSFERGEPLTGGVSRFVPGFTEALTHMRPGDEWLVWIPPALAYGDREKPGIPAGSVLRFRLKLISVRPAS